MRIAHLTSVHAWNDVRAFRKMCRSLARDGHEVHIVAPRKEKARIETVDGVVVHGVPFPRNRLERILKTVGAVVAEAERTNADVYHFHDPELLRPMAALRKRTGKAVVYDVHEDYRDQIPTKKWLPLGTRRFAAWWFGKTEDRLAKEMTAIVTTNSHIGRRFVSHPHWAVVQDFPDLREFEIGPEAEPDREPIPGRFVYVGEITAIRGFREIVKALPLEGESVRLALGGGWENPRFRDELTHLQGWSQVEELGYLDRPAVRRELARAQAGLLLFLPLPNHLKSQPTKLFEYMAAGIPVIASDFESWRRLIGDANCAIFADPTDPADVARAMRWIVEHPAEAREMGRRGRAAARDKYSWATEYRKLSDLYREIAAG